MSRDAHHHHRRMRARHGALAPVDLAPSVPATLVIGHDTAVRILDDLTPADQPVLINPGACAGDPGRPGYHSITGENPAWGAGPHACPAQARTVACLLAEEAIDQLLDALAELRLALDPELPVPPAVPRRHRR